MISNQFRMVPLAILVLSTFPALAQQAAPDAGRLLNENRPAIAPSQAPSHPIVVGVPSLAPQPGGVEVALQGISISGNTLFAESELQALLGDAVGKSYDFAGLSGLAARITAHYHETGYPFARAYLPQQDLTKGFLRIAVVEGRYGNVQAEGDQVFAPRAQAFLSGLPQGSVIASAPLERATLILDDQPGLKIVPVIRPGQEPGTGDLAVDVQRDHLVKGEAGLDNYGNRFTGRYRAHLNLDIDSPFMLGDQIALQSLYTDEQMWFGSLGYHAPLGTSGLRGRIGYTHSYYELGGPFRSLDAAGTANIVSAGLSYPIIRSQNTNLTASGEMSRKRLSDHQDATATRTDKTSDSLSLAVNFDRRDRLGGAGITYGALTFTGGRLKLDSAQEIVDQATARTAGSFNKAMLDIARIQSVTAKLDLFARFAMQRADKNLDSSEKFGLGGINGVRAYPSGEGFGDDGWLSQIELRYTTGPYSPFVFYDAGRVRINHTPYADGENSRSISGAGLGARYSQGPWRAELAVAWRDRGGNSQSDAQSNSPTAWGKILYRF